MSRERSNHTPKSKATRRDFIKTTGAAAIVTAIAPTILGAESKSASGNPIIGSGEHKYEAIHNWGELPSHIQWGETHGVAIDAAGLVYIKHRSSVTEPMDSIAVFDPQGKFVRSFGKEYHGGGHGIDIRKDGGEEFLYLCDVKHQVFAKATLKGEQIWKLGAPEEPGVYKNKEPYSPTNLAFAPDGGLYVADGYGSSYIHQYDKNNKWVRTWGGVGQQTGKMRTPHGIWLDNRPGREPSLVIADRANARLEYYSLDGKYLSTVYGVSFPAHFDIRGTELLVPDLHARVSIFDKDNRVIVHLGYDQAWTDEVLANNFEVRKDPKRWKPGRFIHPHDACYDRDGNIFVAEWVPTGRVSLLKKLS